MRFSDLPALQSFHVDEGNLKYSSEDGILYSKDKTILCAMPGSKDLTSFTIPPMVSEIGELAFANNKKLKEVTIPGTVHRVGNKAFYYAVQLSSVNIEEGVSEIGEECFSFTNDIKEFHIPESVEIIEGGAFSYSQSLENISVAEDNPYFTIVDKGLYSKDLRRFFGLPHLYAISLSEFILHPDCMVVESHAFDGLWNIKQLDLIGRVRYIGSYAAAGCHKLERVTLGPNVSFIGEAAFISRRLKEVECMPYMLDEVDVSAFRNGTLAQEGTLYIPDGTMYFYMQEPWVYDDDQQYQIFANVVEKEFSGIDAPSVKDENPECRSWYSIDGRRLSAPVHGINILVEPNGVTKKVIIP